MRLTDLAIRSLPYEDGQRDYPDEAIAGLGIRVGKRTKTFMLTVKEGTHRRRITLGRYPDDLSLSKARDKARDLIAEARLKKDAPIALTFEAVLQQFKRLHIPSMRRLTQRECTRILSTRFTALYKRHLTTLKTSELATILDGIEAPSERRNAFVWLRVLLTWCYQRGYIDENPIARLKPPSLSRPRERVLSAAEIVKVWRASYHANSAGFGTFVRLLILTGQRKGQWQQFKPDFIHGDTVVFPPEVMKGDKTHTIPLTATVRATIGNHAFKGWNADYQKQQLDNRSGVSGWTLHDLRRTWATISAEELDTPPHIIESVLAHLSGTAVSRVYNRAKYLEPMRHAMLAFEEWLQAFLSTTESTNGSDLPGFHDGRADAAARRT